MATLVVDEYEVWDVAIKTFLGAYLNADMPDEKDARLILEGESVDIICVVNPYHILNIQYIN